MQYLAMKSNDIRRNLATEQYLMNSDQMTPPFMLFYIEDSCIIVGRNQNTLEEINQEYCEEHGVTITRRLSGGGAMYQDMGNMCFSFIVPADEVRFGDFKQLVQPVVDALHDMGATGAMATGRNDIVIDGKKFSGNAMYSRNGKTFSHGTLMLNVDLNVVPQALTVPTDKIASKGIKSVRSRVTNLRPYLAPEYQNITVPEFQDALLKELFHVDSLDQIADKEYHVTPEQQKAIDKIYEDYYANWDWVYGKSPEFSVKRRQHFDMGTIDARISVDDGLINNIKFYGDFFGSGNVQDIEAALKGVRYDHEAIAKALADIDLNQYFTGIERSAVIDLIAQ